MAESKTNRGKTEDGVLGNLPATRPSRLSRRARPDGPNGSTPAKAKAAAAKSAPKTASKPAAKAPAKSTATTATKTPAKPTATPAAKPPAKPTAASAQAAPKPPRPRPVRSGAPQLSEPAAKAEENREVEEQRGGPPSPTELVTTVVKATGELASIGATVAGQLLRHAVDRLPRR